ncbi:hypothetical protein, partial [Comamonas denitrificans]|uniref:hypothetical protein n=1 Tax=Comamonas denitrificans TaxID=117506 RepID=UPI003614CAD2
MATTHNIGIRLSLDATSVTRQAPEAGQRLQAIGNQAQQGAAQATQALARVQMSVADLAKGAIGLGAIGAALQGISAGITALPRNAFNYAKDLEASQLGMAGILSSMTAINGKQLQLHAALQLSSQYIRKLNDDALRTAATSQELTAVFQALLAPGLAAKMSMDEIRQLTVVGTNAVKSMGLDATQVVQELRDLVAGGITPASSTLATALGLKDSDIAAAKASSEGLFNFLMERMRGFEASSAVFNETIKGRLDSIQEGATRVAAEGFSPLIAAAKEALGEVSQVFVEIDKASGSVNLNENLVANLRSASQMALTAGQAMQSAAGMVYEYRGALLTLGQAYALIKIGSFVAGIAQATQAKIEGLQASRLATVQAAAEAAGNTQVAQTSRQKTAAYIAELQSNVALARAGVAAQEARAHAERVAQAAQLATLETAHAAIIAARADVVAKVNATRATMAQAQAQIAAARAAGAQSMALALVREGTQTLMAAQARHAALTNELATLGRQQAGVNASIAAATTAQAAAVTAATKAQAAAKAEATAATNRLDAAQKAASVSVRAFGSVVGMLGGPVGVAITALTALAAAFFSAQRAAEQAALVKLSVDRAAAGKAENEDIARIRGQLSQLKQERDELLVERKTGIFAGIFSDRQIGIASELKTKEADIKRLDAVLKTAEQTAQSAADAAGNGLTLTVEGARQAFNKTLEGVNTKSSILDDFNKKLQASRDAYKALVATGADESALADARARMAEYETALTTERDKALKNLTAGTAQAGAAMAQANKLAVEDVQRSAAAMLGSYEDADAVLSAMRSAGLIGEQEYYQTKIGYLQDEAKIRIQALKDENTLLASQAQGKAKSLEAERQIAKNRAEIARIEQQTLTKTTVLTVEAAAKRNQEAQAVEEQVAKLREEVQARELATAGNISQAQALEQLRLARLAEALAQAKSRGASAEEIAAIEREIAARKELLQVMDGDAARLANAKAAEEAAKDWERTSKTIGDTLADYIMGGGKNAAQYLKRLFSTLVLQPMVQLVVGSVFGLGGAGAAAGQVGQLGQLGNLASGFNNLVSAFGKGAAGAASSVIGKAVPWLYDAGFKSVAQGLGAFQAGMASQQSIAAFTSSLKAGGAQMAGAIAGAVMNGFAGYGISKLISGGYEVNKYVNKIAGIASAIPGVGLIAGVIGGAINRLFGRKLKDTGIEGTFGGEAGFVGNTYEYYKGGVFRSSKTKRNPLDEATRKEFADYYTGMVVGTKSMGDVLGLDSSALDSYTTKIKISLKGLKPEEQEAKIAQEFSRIQNELAQQVIGTWVTNPIVEEAKELFERSKKLGLGGVLGTSNVGSEGGDGVQESEEIKQLRSDIEAFFKANSLGMGLLSGLKLQQIASGNVSAYSPSEYALEGEKAFDTLVRLATSLTTVNAVLEELNGTLYAGSLAGADMAYKLSELFGGMEGFTAATSSFYESFFTADEQRSKLQAKLSEAFSAVDLTLPDIDASNAREQYRALADAQDLTTESGRAAWAVIMQLGEAFASITPSIEDAAQALQQAAAAAVDDALRALQSAVDAQRKIHSARISALQESAAAAKALFDLLARHIDDLRGNVQSTANMAALQGQRTIDQAISAYRATGYLPEAADIGSAAEAARSGLQSERYGNRLDFEADQLVLANKLQTLQAAAGKQLTRIFHRSRATNEYGIALVCPKI